MTKNILARRALCLLLFSLVSLSLSACTLATVRSLSDDDEAKAGFNADDYVAGLWDDQFIPAYREQAVEFTDLVGQIRADEAAAISAHGFRNGTGGYSFMTKGEAQVLEVDTSSRIGFMSLDFEPYDGQADANLAIGPVIRGRNNAATDAVRFIRFQDFVNQTEFAAVSTAIKSRILAEVLNDLDLENIAGKTISFHGAFTLETLDNIELVPIILEVRE